MLALSRTMDSTDYDVFPEELKAVDSFTDEGWLHGRPHRRWEYALALYAVGQWKQRTGARLEHTVPYDVGGADSPFHRMLAAGTGSPVEVIDPRLGSSLEEIVRGGCPLTDLITCLSVLQEVPDLDHFLYLLACLLAPGGLLILTMPYWNACGPDTARGHDERVRIFCPKSYLELRNTSVVRYQLQPFGSVDPRYHGAHVHDHSVASLVLEKRR